MHLRKVVRGSDTRLGSVIEIPARDTMVAVVDLLD